MNFEASRKKVNLAVRWRSQACDTTRIIGQLKPPLTLNFINLKLAFLNLAKCQV